MSESDDSPACPGDYCPNDHGSATTAYAESPGSHVCHECGLVFTEGGAGVTFHGPDPALVDATPTPRGDESDSTDAETRADGGAARPVVLGLDHARFARLMTVAVGGLAFCSVVWSVAGHYGLDSGPTLGAAFAAFAGLVSLVGEYLLARDRDRGGRA